MRFELSNQFALCASQIRQVFAYGREPRRSDLCIAGVQIISATCPEGLHFSWHLPSGGREHTTSSTVPTAQTLHLKLPAIVKFPKAVPQGVRGD